MNISNQSRTPYANYGDLFGSPSGLRENHDTAYFIMVAIATIIYIYMYSEFP